MTFIYFSDVGNKFQVGGWVGGWGGAGSENSKLHCIIMCMWL